jgi:hypothetical protein
MNDAAPQTGGDAPATAPSEPLTMENVDRLLDADRDSEGINEGETTGEGTEANQTPAPNIATTPPEGEEEDPKGDLRVPLRVERERRRQAEALAQTQMEQQRQLATTLAQITQRLMPQAPADEPAPQAPDWNTDPAGYVRHSIDQLNSALQTVQQQQVQQQQLQQQVEAFNQATRSVEDLERGFVEKNPDYYEAVDFVRSKLRAKFEVLGVPANMLNVAVKQDLQRFGLQSLQAGANPAERLFALAKVEGYAGSKASLAAKLDQVSKGQQSTKGARSSAPTSPGAMSMEDAAKLPIKAFQKMSDEDFKALMGG